MGLCWNVPYEIRKKKIFFRNILNNFQVHGNVKKSIFFRFTVLRNIFSKCVSILEHPLRKSKKRVNFFQYFFKGLEALRGQIRKKLIKFR